MTMTMDLTYPRKRAQDDMFLAERDLRQRSDSAYQDLIQILLDMAIRVDGERFEAMRRDNPSVPASWTPVDWKRFFSEVSFPGKGWGSASQPDLRAQRELLQQIEGLKAAIKRLDGELVAERNRPQAEATPKPALPSKVSPAMAAPHASSRKAPKPADDNLPVIDIATLPEEATPPVHVLIDDATQMKSSLPKTPPASFADVLTGGGRVGGDLSRAFERYFITLYLIGRWRLSSSMEIDDILGNTVDLSSGTGSLKRMVADLSKVFIHTEVISIENPQTALKLYRLTDEGARLYQALFSRRPVENEWSRLMRLHEGAHFPNHTLAVIEFAIHARKRGYTTRVFPEIKNSKVTADAHISRGDESLYVEIETDEKERTPKWRSQAALNNGQAAICSATLAARASFIKSCQADHLPGFATDIETLITYRFKDVTSKDPLWQQNW